MWFKGTKNVNLEWLLYLTRWGGEREGLRECSLSKFIFYLIRFRKKGKNLGLRWCQEVRGEECGGTKPVDLEWSFVQMRRKGEVGGGMGG